MKFSRSTEVLPSYYDQKDLEVLWKLHIIHKVGFFIY